MDRSTWNSHIAQFQPAFGGFLQSWEWGSFQRSVGRPVERLFFHEEKTFLAQAIKMDLPFGQHYWVVPKGPLGDMSSAEMINRLRENLPDGVFFRIEPQQHPRTVKVSDVHPATSLVVDLEQSEEDLLASMKSKTRYNIRVAERKGVECRHVDIDHFDDFVRLLDQTSHRDQIRSHQKTYYKSMLEVMQHGEARAFLAMAFYEDRPLAANIIVDFAGQRTYLHGATSNLHRNVMPQYALHWFLMQEAKQKGMKSFDFYGIAPDGADEQHPWFGITRYKKGFGGMIVEDPGTFELQSSFIWYGAYRLAKKIRHLK